MRSALVIQSNGDQIKVQVHSDKAKKKFGGEIWLYHGDYPHELLISTGDTLPFNSKEEAKKELQATIDLIRSKTHDELLGKK